MSSHNGAGSLCDSMQEVSSHNGAGSLCDGMSKVLSHNGAGSLCDSILVFQAPYFVLYFGVAIAIFVIVLYRGGSYLTPPFFYKKLAAQRAGSLCDSM